MRHQQTIVSQFHSAMRQCNWMQFIISKHGTVTQAALATWLPRNPDTIDQMCDRLAHKIASRHWLNRL